MMFVLNIWSILVVAAVNGLLISFAVRILTKRVNLHNQEILIKEWMIHSAANETKERLHAHILKHAQELAEEFEKNGLYDAWSASMQNLLEIFNAFHGIQPDTELRLQRMAFKCLSNPVEFPPPPTPIPLKIVEAVNGVTDDKIAKWNEELAEQEKKRTIRRAARAERWSGS